MAGNADSKIYANVSLEKEPALYDKNEFDESYHKDRDLYRCPKCIKDFMMEGILT